MEYRARVLCDHDELLSVVLEYTRRLLVRFSRLGRSNLLQDRYATMPGARIILGERALSTVQIAEVMTTRCLPLLSTSRSKQSAERIMRLRTRKLLAKDLAFAKNANFAVPSNPFLLTNTHRVLQRRGFRR